MGIPGSQNGGTLVPYFWPYELGVYHGISPYICLYRTYFQLQVVNSAQPVVLSIYLFSFLSCRLVTNDLSLKVCLYPSIFKF